VSRAKRNNLRPPPGWKVYCQWYAEAPDDFAKRTGTSVAGDGEALETRSEAVEAAWDEYEADAAAQPTTGADTEGEQ
jgi:hypothetical protein